MLKFVLVLIFILALALSKICQAYVSGTETALIQMTGAASADPLCAFTLGQVIDNMPINNFLRTVAPDDCNAYNSKLPDCEGDGSSFNVGAAELEKRIDLCKRTCEVKADGTPNNMPEETKRMCRQSFKTRPADDTKVWVDLAGNYTPYLNATNRPTNFTPRRRPVQAACYNRFNKGDTTSQCNADLLLDEIKSTDNSVALKGPGKWCNGRFPNKNDLQYACNVACNDLKDGAELKGCLAAFDTAAASTGLKVTDGTLSSAGGASVKLKDDSQSITGKIVDWEQTNFGPGAEKDEAKRIAQRFYEQSCRIYGDSESPGLAKCKGRSRYKQCTLTKNFGNPMYDSAYGRWRNPGGSVPNMQDQHINRDYWADYCE